MIIIIRGKNYFNEHVAQMGDRSDAYSDVVRRPDERDHLQDLDIEGA
jgi:hypothetical protein